MLQLKDYLEKHNHINISGIWGSAVAFLIAEIFPTLEKNLLIITKNSQKANNVYNDLKFFMSNTTEIYLFPELEIKIYENKNPSSINVAERIKYLYKLLFSKKSFICITSLKNILLKTIPTNVFKNNLLKLKINEEIDFENFKNLLINYGYSREEKVFLPGTFSIRGDIIDIFIPVYENPVRIELFDNIIEKIRFFSPETQRSISSIENITLTPASEFILKDEYINNFQSALKHLIKEQEKIYQSPEKIWSKTFSDFTNIKLSIDNFFETEGYYNFLPLFYKELKTLLDYLSLDTVLFLVNAPDLKEKADAIYDEHFQVYKNYLKKNRPVLSPDNFFLNKAEFFKNVSKFKVIFSEIISSEETKTHFHFKFEGIPSYKGNFNSFKVDFLNNQKQGIEYTFISEHNYNLKDFREKIINHIGEKGIKFKKGKIGNGFISIDFKKAFIQDFEFYGKLKFEEKEKLPLIVETFESISELKEGDYVVHIENGIGIYRGLRHIKSGKVRGDFLEIEYADNMKLFLPVEKMNQIHKYIGNGEKPPTLNKLGTNTFKRTKAYVERSVASVVHDLVKIYAIRQNKSGFRFPPDTEWQREFELSFLYIETPDQIKAIEEIKRDMESARPMDRLICGDVGYGKTEIAIRAAFKAVMAGKQVAVLVPTTILAYQHYNTFIERLKNYPIKVEMLSRFNSKKEQKKILKEIANGKIDIIIGTHRLIQPDVKFYDLGLLIIDEEHRFGVAHKEKLKMARTTIDVITMSATPIPRTLYMALSGIRDVSMINTPPSGRMPVETKIVKFSPDIIRKAILNELNRNGQVFFLHNRVQSIKAIANYIKRIVPEAKVAVIHGQMDEDEIELIMLEFMEKKYDVLVCTTIIEAGIDIPEVNTIIINRADTFGLAQLYQLRGRVGRSNKKSYAYLLVPSEKALTETALKRLLTIFEYTDLGSGYKIALRDLEIRGAGNIFGVQQHGNILAVGLEMYCKILNKVINQLKGEIIEEEIEPDLNFDYSAYIPDEFIPSSNLKIEIYKKLNKCKTNEELLELEKEIKDRFGEKIPAPIKNLFVLQEIKIIAKSNKIISIKKVNEKEYEIIIEIVFKEISQKLKERIREKIENYSFSQDRLCITIEKKNFLINLKKMLLSIF